MSNEPSNANVQQARSELAGAGPQDVERVKAARKRLAAAGLDADADADADVDVDVEERADAKADAKAEADKADARTAAPQGRSARPTTKA